MAIAKRSRVRMGKPIKKGVCCDCLLVYADSIGMHIDSWPKFSREELARPSLPLLHLLDQFLGSDKRQISRCIPH